MGAAFGITTVVCNHAWRKPDQISTALQFMEILATADSTVL